ncbi:hypothetical protein NEMBOFW57_005669 [Staphylotrichum longicolle]|uniref:F-box domain-containing protein n=1 Tax=Staphylotrichum longicolle TaxID=669026 RepID=A0AAD4EXG9_9PEZI|nr:hypothetical protein NEMBOFW57_005669 [Staphylotrichum longicolle]
MRQAASIDIMAGSLTAPGALSDLEDNETPRRRPPQDSRSTSSASSPVPPDNEESDFFHGANDSQSSLGVPNIQDMQVTDECLPPVQRLPNEIQMAIFGKLSSTSDLLHVILTCKRWSRNAVEILWHRPSCSTWKNHESICQTLSLESPYFSYRDFVRRLNLTTLADRLSDGSVMPLAGCKRIERLTLTGCTNLTDSGLIALVTNSSQLYSLDISLDPSKTDTIQHDHITEASIDAVTENCPRLQGLNISGCQRISSESLARLAQRCKSIKRLKLNDCNQVQNDAVLSFAENCPNILEIDLQQCRLVGNEAVTALFAKGRALREVRLAGCDLVDDSAFLSLSPSRTFEQLRILDLSSTLGITDSAIEKIIDMAPRLRNLVLQKCRNLTDAAVYAISRLGKNLHFLHMGHCGLITDDGVKRLVSMCNRIRYIDLGCCVNLTDDSVTRLATLPKLKRIGLVKCANITDISVIALANANRRPRSIIRLLNSCPRLTHLSLTGVQAFLREDLEKFSRPAPREFTDHQRSVFCVFSGQGVVNLRKHFNRIIAAEDSRRTGRPTSSEPFPPLVPVNAGFGGGNPGPQGEGNVPEDGMVIDTHPPAQAGIAPDAPWAEQPLPLTSDNPFSFAYVATHPPFAPVWLPWPEDPATTGEGSATPQENLPAGEAVGDENGDAAQVGAGSTSGAVAASTSADAHTDGPGDMSPIPTAMIDISSAPDANGNFVTPQNQQMPPPGGSGGP